MSRAARPRLRPVAAGLAVAGALGAGGTAGRWALAAAPGRGRGRARVALRGLERPSPATVGKQYPPLDFEAFQGNVELLHEEPPVWRIHGFLGPEDCEALMEEGREERRPEKVYEGSFVVFDEDRLRPLALTAPLFAGSAYCFHDGDPVATAIGFGVGLVLVALLKEVVRWYLADVAGAGGRGGARFLGRKWQLGPPLATAAQGARERLLERVRALCRVRSTRWLEPPFLTRYRLGEGQDAHLDSKERPGLDDTPSAHDRFIAMGGQRMVQCLCYLNDVDINAHDGATKFLKEGLAGLRVEPQAGSALVFCTAFADGQEDARMVHCAEPLRGPEEVEKWIVPVWSLEAEHPDWRQWEEPAPDP